MFTDVSMQSSESSAYGWSFYWLELNKTVSVIMNLAQSGCSLVAQAHSRLTNQTISGWVLELMMTY